MTLVDWSLTSYSVAMEYILRRMMDRRINWFMAGLRDGLSSPVEIYTSESYRIEISTVEGMRSDWERIGQDFRTVIGREYVETAEESRRIA